ncbi:hypothetical protein GQ457_07G004850 [Hibiscus cannabinus]
MFLDILSSIQKSVLPNSDPKTSEFDLKPEFAYHDLIEGSVGRRDRPHAQPNSPDLLSLVSRLLPVNLSDSSRTSLCGYCGFWHKGECRKNTDSCYHCGSRYHLLKDCPQRPSTA